MESVKELVNAFRQAGLRITPQRRVIFKLLVDRSDHPTAEDVYEDAVLMMPDISRATVYNTLGQLVELGQVDKIDSVVEAAARYDTNVKTHHHLYCVRCGRIVDVYADLAGLDLAPDQRAGYKILKHRVTFYGYCPECQEKVHALERRVQAQPEVVGD